MGYRDFRVNLKRLVKSNQADPKDFVFKYCRCAQLWDSPYIHWNADILGCCFSYTRPFSSGSFSNILERMNIGYLAETRKILLGELPREAMSQENPCYVCSDMNDSDIFPSIKNYIQSRYKGKAILSSEDITFIQLEFTTNCQLNCPGCWRNLFPMKDILPRGYLKPDDLRTLLENSDLKHLKKIDYTLNGESLLNPHFVELLKICYDHSIETLADIGLNFNYITDEQIEAIVDAKVHHIRIALDGVRQETYSRYRINGNFDKVIENIKRLQAYKQKVNSKYPRLIWGMIGFNWNVREIWIARKMAEDLGMKFHIKRNSASKVDQFTSENELIYLKHYEEIEREKREE